MSAARTFRTTQFGAPGVSQQSLGIPTAAYPGRVATNSDLIIAVDRQQTTLLLPLTAAATTMTVLDPSMIVAYSLLSIDNEIVKTTGPPAGNVIPISRGFDGTAPAVHLANAFVSGLVDAYHHNVLVAEIEAIETALGPNLSAVPGGSPLVVSTAFQFTPQSPGGNLIVGNNSILLTPVPKGVNGSDQTHYLYISGGTGAAEAVLITGGSAVSGAASGTVIVNCANAHSGAWTIQTATAGIQEAIVSLPATGGRVYVPPGSQSITGEIAITKGGVLLEGSARYGTTLTCTNGTLDCILVQGANEVTIRDMAIVGSGKTGGWAVNTSNTGYLTISELWIDHMPNGINLYLNTVAFVQGINIRDLTTSSIGIAIFAGGDQMVSKIVMDWDGSNYYFAGINIQATGGCQFSNLDIIHANYGFLINNIAGTEVISVLVEQAWFDNSGQSGISIQPASVGVGGAPGVQDCRFTDCWTASGAGNGVDTGGAGTYRDINFKGLVSFNNANYGLSIGPQGNVNVTHSTIAANSQAAAGSRANVVVGGGASNWRIDNSTIGGPFYTVLDKASYALQVLGGAGDYFSVLGNQFFAGSAGAISDGATGTHARIESNLGWNPVGFTPITVGASPFTYTAGHSPEVVYIQGGTVSNVNRGGAGVGFSSSPCLIPLPPGGTVTVTYSVAPAMVKDAQ